MVKPDTGPGSGSGGGQNGSYIFPKRTSGSPLLGSGFSKAAVIGLHPLGGMLVGGGIGYWLRYEFGVAWGFPVFLLVGLFAGCLNAYRDARLLLREEETNHDAKKPPRR